MELKSIRKRLEAAVFSQASPTTTPQLILTSRGFYFISIECKGILMVVLLVIYIVYYIALNVNISVRHLSAVPVGVRESPKPDLSAVPHNLQGERANSDRCWDMGEMKYVYCPARNIGCQYKAYNWSRVKPRKNQP
jgi:hypothetical protein